VETAVRLLIALPVLVVALLALPGCPPTTCQADDEATIELGHGISSAFARYTDGQTVTIERASQGGWGFPILIRSVGLEAGADVDAAVVMRTVLEGTETGFWNQFTKLTCDADGGRTPSTLHVGFDPEEYGTLDDFNFLVGEQIDLDVTLTDPSGNTAEVVQTVTLALGAE